MENYDVYFEVFGKKMKTRVLAEDEIEARQKVLDKILFHAVKKPKQKIKKH